MICPRCNLESRYFPSEIAIHFPGLDGLNKPVVHVFPQICICVGCGNAEFVVPEPERKVLRDGKLVQGVVASL